MECGLAFVTAADFREGSGGQISMSSAYRRATELGAVRVGRRLLVPLAAIRRKYGPHFAALVEEAAKKRRRGRP